MRSFESYRALRPDLRGQGPPLALGAACLVASSAFTFAVPWVMKVAIPLRRHPGLLQEADDR